MEPLGEVREGTRVECPGTQRGFCRAASPLLLPSWRLSHLRLALSSAPSWLQVITLEGWVEIMYYVMDAHSFYNFIYFILLIIVSVRGAGALWAKAQGPMGQGTPEWGRGSLGVPRCPCRARVLSRREQEGQFVNAAEQQVAEGARRGGRGGIHHFRLPSLLISGHLSPPAAPACVSLPRSLWEYILL